MRRPRVLRAALAIGIAVAAATCRDAPTAPLRGGRAVLAVRPVFRASTDVQSFGLTIDSLRVVIVRPAADTLRDTTVFFSPDSSSVSLPLAVELRAASESLAVTLVLSAGGVPLFSGTVVVRVTVGSAGGAAPTDVPLAFTGPGAGVTALHLAPRDTVLRLGDSLRFRVSADSAGAPVTEFYTAWRTSDSAIARINAFGILHAPATRDTVTVVVRTFSGAADSTLVTFAPAPTALAVVSGAGQSGAAGAALPQPLTARVTAVDGLGVKGVVVRFSALAAGAAVADSAVVTDTGGYARTVATLGPTAGGQSFQGAAPGLTAVSFAESATPAPPAQLVVSAGDGQSAVVASALPVRPAVLVKDRFNNVVPGVAVTWTVSGGGGSVTGAADTTNGLGIATLGGWTLGTAAGPNTVRAAVDSLTLTFSATGNPGPVSASGSTVAVPLDTLTSGTVTTVTLTARDQYGNAIGRGGDTVTFAVSGGTSTGTFSAVTDHGNGTYTATFQGSVAGTPDTVHATLDRVAVTSPLPLIRVLPGAASLAQSVVTADSATIASARATIVRLTAKDAAGNAIPTGGLGVAFSATGPGTGTLSTTTDQGNGTYTAAFTGVLAGADTIHATIGGQPVTSTPPVVLVVPGAESPARSTVALQSAAVASGVADTVTLTARDSAGNRLTTGGLSVAFSDSGGTSTGTFSAVVDHGDGTYTVLFTGALAGTATTIHATINGAPVTTALPAVTVTAGAFSALTSVVSVDTATVVAGQATTLRLQAKDAAGNPLTTGGLGGVVFRIRGAVTDSVAAADNLNGTYTAPYAPNVAGIDTIGASVGGTVVASRAALSVVAGAVSTARSTIAVAAASVASGGGDTLTLVARDAAGNVLPSGGLTVVFDTTGGTSTGTISATTDHGNGTYTAVFTGVGAGTAVTIGATINGAPVTSAAPAVTVTAGAVSLATSSVSVGASTITAGAATTVTLTAKDAAGNTLSSGGLSVAFADSGGTSAGTFSSVTDHGNGSYTATFTGVTAGTAVTVQATIGGGRVAHTASVTVVPGNTTAAQSVVSVRAPTVLSGAADTIVLQAKDSLGNNITTGGLTVVFADSGGTSTGTVSATTDHGDGTYTATFTGLAAGTAVTIHATINGIPVTSTLPTITVLAGAVSTAQSVVTAGAGTLISGAATTVTLQAKDSLGNAIATGGLSVAFSASGGTSTGTFSGVTDHGDGTYTASFTGILAGTATTIHATIGGSAVTSALPTIAVLPGAPSTATSTVTVASATLAAGVSELVTLTAFDANGNAVTAGGASVAFAAAGGTSTGSFSAVTDHGDGTYTATFTGLVAGTATAIGATLGGSPVTTTLPTVTVTPGVPSAAKSVVTAGAASVASGLGVLLKLQAKDSLGNVVTTGGATVTFAVTGGTSTGTLGAVVDSGTGVYTAPFTGLVAGTPDTVHASVNGAAVTTPLPLLQVTAGAASPLQSLVTISADSVTSGAFVTVTLAARDSVGNAKTTGGDTVTFGLQGGTSTGTFSAVTDHGDGTYSATLTGVLAGTLDTVEAVVDGRAVVTARPTVRVLPGPVSTATSLVTVADSVAVAGLADSVSLLARDLAGNAVPDSTLVVAFTLAGGTSAGSFGPVAYAGGGRYVALFTGLTAGTPVTVNATIGGQPVTSAPPSLRVSSTVHTANILADSTWTLAASPHVVSGYLKIANGATLTIEPGAVVQFDTASGFQVGDTAGASAGMLAADSVDFTAHAASPSPGAWRGIEVQRTAAPATWRGLTVEWADTGIRVVSGTAATLALDGVRVRAAGAAALAVHAGRLEVRRSVVDTAGADGILADGAAQLLVDSTTVRGAAGLGLDVASPAVVLDTVRGNRFVGNHGGSALLAASQLQGFFGQDSITGNAPDTIQVTGSALDPATATLVWHRQPAPYLVFGTVTAGRAAGQTLVLDTGLVVAFDATGGLNVGDLAGAAPGQLVSRGGPTSPVVLRWRTSGTPWAGVALGAQSAPDSLDFLRIVGGGTAGAGLSVAATAGVAAFTAQTVVVDSSSGYGIAVTALPVGATLVLQADTARASGAAGLYVTVPLGTGAGSSIAGNALIGNGYPAEFWAGALPALGVNTAGGNVRDTLLLDGGTVTGAASLPAVPGVPWRVTGAVGVDSGGALRVVQGQTVFFDDTASVTVGVSATGAFDAVGTGAQPIVFTATPGHASWRGLFFSSQWRADTLRNVLIEDAGYTAPCPFDCLPFVFGSVDFENAGPDSLFMDSVTVRNAVTYVIRAVPGGSGAVVATNSQFYAIGNGFSANPGAALNVSGSDIYDYQTAGWMVVGGSAGDSVVMRDNWWGDVAGPGTCATSSCANDSIGRPQLQEYYYPTAYVPFATAPHFPTGSATALVATPDSVTPGVSAGTALPIDSVRVRAVDAEGRGVAGVSVTWSAAAGSGAIAGSGLVTDAGGRTGAVWTVGTVAGTDTATAQGPGSVRFYAPVYPGALVSAHWQYVPALTQGTVSVLGDTAAFTSTNRVAAVVTSAVDAFGNTVTPSLLYFDNLPGTGIAQSYGTITKEAGDTIWFVPTVTAPSSFQLHAVYDSTALGRDSVIVTIAPVGVAVAAGANGLGFTPVDSATINSLCAGATNASCGRVYEAFVLDSGGTPLSVPTGYAYRWDLTDSARATIDSTVNNGQFVYLTARTTGTDTLIVTDTLAPDANLAVKVDTIVLTVDQVAAQVALSPDSVSTGMGDTVTFHAAVADSGGSPLAVQPPIAWRIDSLYAGVVRLDSAADSLRVRFDSGYWGYYPYPYPRWFGLVQAMAARAPGDTITGQGALLNPIDYALSGGGGSAGSPTHAEVDPVHHWVSVLDQSASTVTVSRTDSNKVWGTVSVGTGPIWGAVDPGLNRLFTSNNSAHTVSVIAEPDTVLQAITIPGTPGIPYGMAVDTASHRVFVAAQSCTVGVSSLICHAYVMTLDALGDSVITANTILLGVDQSLVPKGIAYDAKTRLLYVSRDSVLLVVDPVALAVKDSIPLPGTAGTLPFDVAVNDSTDRIYVTYPTFGLLFVVDGGTNTVVNTLNINSAAGVSVDVSHHRAYVASSSNNAITVLPTDSVTQYYVVGTSSPDFPQDAAVDPVTGTVYAPHGTTLEVLQFYGPRSPAPLLAPPRFGALAGPVAPPRRGLANTPNLPPATLRPARAGAAAGATTTGARAPLAAPRRAAVRGPWQGGAKPPRPAAPPAPIAQRTLVRPAPPHAGGPRGAVLPPARRGRPAVRAVTPPARRPPGARSSPR